jgi:hypothetical protein
MLGSSTLDVAIGLVFVFVLVSIVCTAIREGIESFLKTRASYLELGIRELLHDRDAAGLARQFFNHPLIYGLYGGGYSATPTGGLLPTGLTRGRNLPSYIPTRSFALALMDMAARGPDVDHVSSHPGSGMLTFDEMRTNVTRLGNPAVQRVLLTALDSAQGNLQQAQANIEAWYDSSMDRVSGWYKRATQWMLFVIALFVVVVMNIDSLRIAEYLHREEAARRALVAGAERAVADPNFVAQSYSAARTELSSYSLPIGWTRPAGDPKPVVNGLSIFGWLITAFAASLGAPFWFDLLNKLMVIRSTVKPHEKSPEESSEDRQLGSSAQATARDIPVGVGTFITSPPATPTPPAPPDTPENVKPPDLTARLDPEHIDGCDVEIRDFTPDEELPAAKGGVAAKEGVA